jgi:putative redox protein
MIRSTSLDTPYQTPFTNGSHSGIADIPIEKGGAGQGLGPHELLEAALATCVAITVRLSAAKHGFPLESLVCEVRLDRSNPDAVALNYDLSLNGPLSEEQIAHLRRAASRCPVTKTLTGGLTVRATGSEAAG